MTSSSFVCRELRLRHFRNFAELELVFPAEGVAVIGDNGSGKTNLLEAVYLALTGLSDAGRLEQLVLRSEREAYLRAELWQGGSLSVLEVGLGRGRRTLKADGVRVIDPDEGEMACGEFGPGRLPEPAAIMEWLITHEFLTAK